MWRVSVFLAILRDVFCLAPLVTEKTTSRTAARCLMPANGSRDKTKFAQPTINKTTKQGMLARRRRSVNVNSRGENAFDGFYCCRSTFFTFFSRVFLLIRFEISWIVSLGVGAQSPKEKIKLKSDGTGFRWTRI